MIYKYPESVTLPVIVPRGAQVRTLPGDQSEEIVEVSPLILIFGAALILSIPERALPLRSRVKSSGGNKTPPFLGSVYPHRGKSRRLFYMYQTEDSPPVSIPKAKARKMIEGWREGKSQNGWLYPIWSTSADMARKEIAAGLKPYNPFIGTNLSGEIMNCADWQIAQGQGGDEVWRCSIYYPSCAPASSECAPPGGRLKTCVKTKKVFSPFYDREVSRCAEYARSCGSGPCIDYTRPTPERYLRRSFDAKVRDMAKSLAEDANISEAPWIAKEILSRGGLRSYKGGAEKEEYSEGVPLHLRNRRGLPPDEMAAEMNMTSQQLFDEIAKAYPKGRKKKKQRYTWEDFRDQAEGIVARSEESMEQEEGFWGLGAFKPVPGINEGTAEQDLFPDLKRELVLTAEDVATSDDPLEICLQRRGWKIPRVQALQAKISAKMTPDMWGRTGQKLTFTETQLQQDIDKCLQRFRKKPALDPSGQYQLFGDLWIQEAGLKKGAFRAQAKRAGMETQEFADYVLSHPEKFQKITRTRARLAKTFKRISRGEYR